MGRFEPKCWAGPDAAKLVGAFAEIERLAAAGKTLAAGQVERTNGWRAGGHRSAGEWLARETGSSVSVAGEVLATASRVAQLPATEDALRAGALSPEQAAAVSSGGLADPDAEARLLADAAKEPVSVLRRQAQAVRQAAAGRSGAEDRDRIHRSRYFRHWTAADGAFEGRFKVTADHGATLLAALGVQREQVYRDARAAGVRDDSDAYEADALIALARAAATPNAAGSSAGPSAMINIRVDRTALVRGHTEAGEVCEIAGIGPVPVATVRHAECDAILKVLLVEGDQVIDVRHIGRTVPAALRVAITGRDRVCVVPGCDRTRNLEIHHLVPFSQGGPTTLENMGRVCHFHHAQISYRGAQLTGPAPFWQWNPPSPRCTPDGPASAQPLSPNHEDPVVRIDHGSCTDQEAVPHTCGTFGCAQAVSRRADQ